MAFALGYIDTPLLLNVKNFYSVKEDQFEENNIQVYRGGDNNLFASEKGAKAEISLDMDFISDTDFGNLRDVLLNKAYPSKIYIRQPGNISGAILHPSTAVNKAYVLKNSVAVPSLASFTTEMVTADYAHLSQFSSPCAYQSSADEYIHYLFTFDLSTWLSGSAYENLLRLTLFMQTPVAYRVNTSPLPTDKYGIIVRAYNQVSTNWLEIYRRSITLTATNQQAAGLRPMTGFTRMGEYITDPEGGDPNKVRFMVSILQPRNGQGTIHLDMNYTVLLVNGFMVRMAENFNINWREEVTLVGRTGNLKLSEV